jgi:hypothetical protein
MLLRSAAAPPSPIELAGEQEALAAFRLASHRPKPVRPVPSRPRRSAALSRAFAIKAAAGTAVVLAGSVAVAAEAGALPAPAQRSVHHLLAPLGVPPEPARAPTGAPVSARPSAPASQAAPGPTGSRTAAPPLLELCRAYRKALSGKNGGQGLDGEARRVLAEAAGDAKKVDAYCTQLLAVTPPPSATPPAPAPSAKSNDGNNGNNSNNGNMHGQSSADPGGKHHP